MDGSVAKKECPWLPGTVANGPRRRGAKLAGLVRHRVCRMLAFVRRFGWQSKNVLAVTL
jgi:hypothetical protein